MSENREELPQVTPTELKPEGKVTFRGLCGATLDAVRLYRSDPDKINPIGAMTLIGMKAAFPERFTYEQLRSNPNLKFFTHFAWLGVEVNDAVDIIPQARREERQEAIENVFSWWKKAIRHTRAEADLSPEESAQKRQLMRDYQREILFLEKLTRETPEADWNLEKTIRYREVMNAISVVHNAAALLGNEALPSRLNTIDKGNLSWEALEKKYSWMVDGKPENETERRLCALFNLVMAVQVIDDWYDVEDDKKLGLHTVATQLIREEGEINRVEVEARRLTNNYFKRAELYGATKMAGMGLEKFMITFKKLLRRFAHRAGRRERLLNGGEAILKGKQIRP